MCVCGVCRSIKLTSLRAVSEDFGIPNFGQLLGKQIEEDWGHDVGGVVIRYNQNVLLDSICIKLQNRLLYDHQPFHNSTSVEHLGLGYMVEYTNTNPGIMAEAYNIWVQYMQSEENDLNNTLQEEFLHFLYCTSLGLHRIRSSIFRNVSQLGSHYQPFVSCARRLNNGYYILKLKNTQ
jgi:hypothetical protein